MTAFHAYLTGNQSRAEGNTFVHGAEYFDPDGVYDTSTGDFIVPASWSGKFASLFAQSRVGPAVSRDTIEIHRSTDGGSTFSRIAGVEASGANNLTAMNCQTGPLLMTTGHRYQMRRGNGVNAAVTYTSPVTSFSGILHSESPAARDLVRLEKTATQLFTSGAFSEINFEKAEFDTQGGFYDATNDRITVPGGYTSSYGIASAGFNTVGTAPARGLYLTRFDSGGTRRERAQFISAGQNRMTVAMAVRVQAGDYFEAEVFANGGTVDVGTSRDNFMALEVFR